MMQTQAQSEHFDDRKMAESLLGQAHLCEQIASACTDESAAAKFKKMARDCRQAAEDCVVRNLTPQPVPPSQWVLTRISVA